MDEPQENSNEQTPNKNLKTPKKPRKQKTFKSETKGKKAQFFFDEGCTREENGVPKQYYICQLCSKEVVGTNPTNLASHLLHIHREVYNEHIGNVEEPILISRLKLLQNCVSIITLGGRPINSLLDYGFQKIVCNQLKQFANAGHPLDLTKKNQPAVHEYLHHAADLVREKIKANIKSRPVSIQIDLASRLGRSVFGIDVQYVEKSNIIIHNIGMVVMDKAHTSDNLLQIYRKCLNRYNIERTQVISVSADNGKDVQKMIRLEKINSGEEPPRKKAAIRLDFDVADLYNQPQQKDKIDREISEILVTEEPSDDDAIDMIFGECDIELENSIESEQFANILPQIISQISAEYGHLSFELSGIRCAAHTLQLVVKDALNKMPEETKNIILLCRRVVKTLRLESTKYLLEGTGLQLKKPKLDVETRWGSTFVMVSDKRTFLFSFLLFCKIPSRNYICISLLLLELLTFFALEYKL